MTRRPRPERPLRVLVHAPVGRDSEVLADALDAAGVESFVCASMAEVCEQIEAGAGALVVAGEALMGEGRTLVDAALERQPEWSDFPLIIMDTPRLGKEHGGEARPPIAGHAVILVRPVHSYTLLSAVRSALRSRTRQYEVRDELHYRQQAETALRQANERKDEFLAMLGHELRNPLAAIRNATELIRIIGPEDARLMKAHGVLDRQSTHMSQLIDGLLEVSRIARGKIRLDRETLDLRVVVQHGLNDHWRAFVENDLELKRSLPDAPAWVHADRVRLAQVFDNLLSNAIKFSDPGGTVRVTLTADDNSAFVRVENTGIGIREEMLERLFEPFQQDTRDMARPTGGLGLGMALAKGLVEMHDGRISAHSEGPGRGACFVVQLALADAPTAVSDERVPRPSAPRRVLVVEDNPDAGQSLCDLLAAMGHDAMVATDGPAALEMLDSRMPGVVLCDIGLPGMSGYDLAWAVRQQHGDLPLLVAVTGYGQPEDQQRAARAGFDHHLTKPVDVAALNAILSSLGAGGRAAENPKGAGPGF